jgi:hypothetical protein
MSDARARTSRAPAGVDAGAAVDRLGRIGLVAKGVLYAVVALLALQLALGIGGEATGQEGAIERIAGQPFGTVLLVLLAIGIAGYVVWRFAQASFPAPGVKTAKRVVFAVRGALYLVLLGFTIDVIAGSSGGGGGQTTGGLLGLPGGRVLVGLLGLVILGVGALQGYKAFRKTFLEDLDTARMSPAERTWAERLGVLAFAARMVVFLLLGFFVLRAAIRFDPNQPVGLDAALAELAAGPAGPIGLGIVAVGLLAYAALCIGVLARFGRMRTMD